LILTPDPIFPKWVDQWDVPDSPDLRVPIQLYDISAPSFVQNFDRLQS